MSDMPFVYSHGPQLDKSVSPPMFRAIPPAISVKDGMFGEEDLKVSSPHLHSLTQSDLSQLLMNGHGATGIGGGTTVHMNGGGGDRQSSTDRSISATPSQGEDAEADEPQDLEEEGGGQLEAAERSPAQPECDVTTTASSGNSQPADVQREMSELKTGFVYMSHQMSRIMKALHVPPCMCETCSTRHLQMMGSRPMEDPSQMLAALFPNANAMQLTALADLAKAGKQQHQQQQQQQQQQNVHQQQYQHQLQQQRMGTGYGQAAGGGKIQSAATDKRIVAEYARQHGAVAAAKRFGIPPPVSTYYQRKDSSNALVNPATASPGPSSEGENDNSSQASEAANNLQQQQQQQQQMNQQAAGNMSVMPGQTPHQQQQNPAVASPLFPGNMGNMMDMSAMLKMNAAHASGSPGFLRGRGRGRPKLIGDELDADLVDYMVTVKQTDPHGHLTASQALIIAKQYILEKAPGLLEEHGGHVKLKLTWAMKLVSRIAERQKEIELGLPAGTLSNMGRHQLNNLPGGNFMADIMAQNILSQHVMMGMGAAGGNGSSDSPPTSQPSQEKEVVEEPKVGATPEITNVQELNLKFLNNLFNGGGGGKDEEMSGLIEGELPACQEERPYAGEVPMTISN